MAISNLNFIIYYAYSMFPQRESHLFVLAHEFAHVFFNDAIECRDPSYEEFQRRDKRADEQAIEWGFYPHPDHKEKFFLYNKRNQPNT